MKRTFLLALLLVPLLPALAAAGALPLAQDVEWSSLKQDVRRLLTEVADRKGVLPAHCLDQLRAVLDREPADPDKASQQVQELLDPQCLVGVTINPESRV